MKIIFGLLLVVGFSLPSVSRGDDSKKEEPGIMEKVDKELQKAKKTTVKKLNEIDDNLTAESQKWNKKVFGKNKNKSSEKETQKEE